MNEAGCLLYLLGLIILIPKQTNVGADPKIYNYTICNKPSLVACLFVYVNVNMCRALIPYSEVF